MATLIIGQVVDHAFAIARGDKRLRPYLISLMFRTAGGGWRPPARQVKMAIEFFHLALLIHDDVMDRGLIRHHQPTFHRFVTAKLGLAGRLIEGAEHIGYAQAISLGDLFLAIAADLLFPTGDRRVWRIWQTMFSDVVAGQMLDVDGTTRRRVSADFIERKAS